MARLLVILLALFLFAVPLLGEAGCDDCTQEPSGTSCAGCVLCLCCGQIWAARPAPAQPFLLGPCGKAFETRPDLAYPPAPREIFHIPLDWFA